METFRHHTKLKHWERYYLIVCMTMIAFSACLMGYWLLFPQRTIWLTGSVTTDKTIYRPGDRLTYYLPYCKTKDIPGTVYRTLVNSVKISFTTVQSNLPMGCHTVAISELVIPDYVDTGIYHIEGDGERVANPLVKVYTHWKTNDFKIVK